jgi:hypothetical protein
MKSRRLAAAAFAAGLVLGAALPVRAQLLLGQYEPEAPFRTWNAFPYRSPAALGRGEASFAWPADAAAIPSNPALLFSLPKTTFVAAGSLGGASFFKFGPVNTGIFSSAGPVWLNVPAFDFAGATFRSGRLAVAASVHLAEVYDRPLAAYQFRSRDILQYEIRFEQTGWMRVANLSFGWRLGSRLDLGFGLNSAAGRLESTLTESWLNPGRTITDSKTHRYRGFFLNSGLVFRITPGIAAAAVVRAPFDKTAKSDSRVRYQAPAGGTDIVISGEADDVLRQPLMAGFGLTIELLDGLRVGADLSYFAWKTYEAAWFEEAQTRDFRNILRIGGGIEYTFRFRFLGASTEGLARAGVVDDPQPMKTPAAAYFGYTTGAGLRWRGFVIDFGFLSAAESGSGDGLKARRTALSLGYAF